MNKRALENAINQLLIWVADLNNSNVEDDVTLKLKELGITHSSRRGIEFREDPNLEDHVYFQMTYVKGFKKIRRDFLEIYNAELVKRGRKPVPTRELLAA